MFMNRKARPVASPIERLPAEGTALALLRIAREPDRVTLPGRRCREPTRDRLWRKYRQLKLAHDHLVDQLYLAEQVHAQLLRHPLPKPPRVSLGAAIRPAHHLAGDFYSAFRLDSSRLGIYVGDVMGHGPAAALLGIFAVQAMVTRTVEGHHYEILPPEVALGRLNEVVKDAEIPGSPFITMTYGIMDTEAATWTYCGAGHPPAILFREGSSPCFLESNSPLLGVLDLPFSASTVALEPGDRLLLYSDGAQAAEWSDRGTGMEGLIATFATRREDVPPQRQVEEALGSLTFAPGIPADDVALVLVEYQP